MTTEQYFQMCELPVSEFVFKGASLDELLAYFEKITGIEPFKRPETIRMTRRDVGGFDIHYEY